jgi:hypothetical protein
VSSGKAIDINLTQTGGNGRALSITPTGGASLSGSTSLVQVSVPRVLSEAALYATGNFSGPLLTAVGSARAVLATSPNQALKISHTGTPTGASIDLSGASCFAYPWPVITSAQRAALTSQPAGSTVFDSNYQTLWCFNGTSWQNQLVPDNITLEYNGTALQVKDQGVAYSLLGAAPPEITAAIAAGPLSTNETTLATLSVTTTKPNQFVVLSPTGSIGKTSTANQLNLTFRIKQNGTLLCSRVIGGVRASPTDVGPTDLNVANYFWTIATPGTYTIVLTVQSAVANEVSISGTARLVLR